MSDSEIGRQKPVLSDSEIGRLPKMHFRQFDANSTHSRRPRGNADAEVAQNGENAKARIGKANRAPKAVRMRATK